MAVILDIAGKPLPSRKQSKNRLRAQDMRDLLKALVMLSLIIFGYLLFVPNDSPAQSAQTPVQHKSQAG